MFPLLLLLLPAVSVSGQSPPDSAVLVRSFRHKGSDRIEKILYDPYSGSGFSVTGHDMKGWGGDDPLLQTSGSLSRGIRVGNGQDMSVDSYLDLRINGMLSDRLSVTAHISDRNLPLQSAATQQWKEFDRIFVRMDYSSLRNNSVRVLAGDVDLKDDGTWFLRFSRQGLGAVFRFASPDTALRSCSVSISEAVAKGTFRRQQLVAVEGVQGGYRLTGLNGERQIVVLSASEKVYIDGVLLKRGEDADYTLDYQLAEITFTARQPITKDKRIVVEFEYSDQQYVRSLTHLQTSIGRKAWDFSFDFYNEQDLRHQSGQLELDAASIAFLQALDQGGPAYYPYADSVGFLPDEVLYRRVDTIVGGVKYDSVYVYSTNRDSACYRLRFSYLGEGRGNYVALQSGVNGQMYAWVAPVNGMPQGCYEPALLLVPPQRRQMYSLRGAFRGGKSSFYAETALSNHDWNTFSKKDITSPGFAFRTGYRTRLNWGGENRVWTLVPDFRYEGKAAGFGEVDAYRDVEFVRNFNLPDSLRTGKGEHFAEASLQLESPRNNLLRLQSTACSIPASGWSAMRYSLLLRERVRDFSADADAAWLDSRTADYRTFFLKHKETVSHRLSFLRVGVVEDMEWNRYMTIASDSLMPESNAYNEFGMFIKPADTSATSVQYTLHFKQRSDFSVWERKLRMFSDARQMKATLDMLKFRNHPVHFTLSYRNLHSMDSLWTHVVPEQTILGSFNSQGRWANGAVQTGWNATLGSEMENRVSYSYLKVADGQGAYCWKDYNGNGIQELDEFELAHYRDEAAYVRVYLSGQELEKVYSTTWTQRLMLRPEAVWGRASGWRKWFSMFSNNTALQSQLKRSVAAVREAASPVGMLLNPFSDPLADTALRGGSFQFRNVLSFRPSHPAYGAEGLYMRQKNKYMTVNGFEYSSVENWQFSVRYRWGEALLSRFSFLHGKQSSKSDYFSTRNYCLTGETSHFSIQYPFSNRFALTLSYRYRWQSNDEGEERLFSNSLEGEATYRMPKRGSFYAKCRYEHILFHGNTNSPVAYVMTEALSDGANAVVNAAYQHRLGEFMQIDLSYEGRLSSQGFRHAGTMTLKALF